MNHQVILYNLLKSQQWLFFSKSVWRMRVRFWIQINMWVASIKEVVLISSYCKKMKVKTELPAFSFQNHFFSIVSILMRQSNSYNMLIFYHQTQIITYFVENLFSCLGISWVSIRLSIEFSTCNLMEQFITLANGKNIYIR